MASSNVLFIHGISVRQEAYDKQFQKVKSQLKIFLPTATFHQCYWGGLGGRLNLEEPPFLPLTKT
jgi:hypothetical protein